MSETGLWGGLGEGRWSERCGAVRCSLACDRGWRGVAPSVAVFQCSVCFFFPPLLSLGTSVKEVNAVLYVMCDCLQNRVCVCVCQ